MTDVARQFLFQTTPRIRFGIGALEGLSGELKRFAPATVLIVSDPGVIAAGIAGRVQDLAASTGALTHIFGAVEPDPRIETAEACARLAAEVDADLIIGVGGGSAMDIAKVASILARTEQPIATMFGVDLVKSPGLPLILIPTTAGTGSEVTHIAILSDETEHLKKGIVSPFLFPVVAINDPALSVGAPQSVTAASGMDALLHAVEAFTSKNASIVTDTLAKQAIRLISQNLRSAYADGSNIAARAAMLEGSMLAGIAFANAGVTAVHAFAYPIGAEFHIPHGVANSIMMGPVLTFNLVGNLQKFAEIAGVLGAQTSGLSQRDQALLAVQTMKLLAEDIRIPKHLADFGIREEHLPGLADGVLKVTRLLANNPRFLSRDDAIQIYREVL
ncbi:MAG: iron-containing alcohol dehydrogenase [Pseudomonadota bacterium]